MHLPLADGDLLEGEVTGLELGEEQLCRGQVVAVGTQVKQRDLKSLKDPPRPLGRVIAGVVPKDDSVLSPVCVLLVQQLDQLREVELHDLLVAVGLQEAEEDGAVVVDGGDEGDPRLDVDLPLPRAALLRLPAAPLIAHGVQPALVDVDEPALALEQPEEDEGALLPQDQAPRGVGLWGQPDDLPVAEANLVPHDVAHAMLLEVLAVDLRELPRNLLDRPDLFPPSHLRLHEVHQLEVLQLSLRPLRNQLPEEGRLLPRLSDNLGDYGKGDVELLRQV